MSFMVIRGKAYHCNTCEKEVKVEYQGGAQLTQIGDEYFQMQQELNKKYNNEAYEGDKEGYYFHIEGLICQECFDKSFRVKGDSNILKEQNHVADIGEIIDTYKEEIDNMVDDILPDILSSIEFENLRYVNEENYDEAVTSKAFQVPSKRAKLIEEFIDENSEEVNDHIITKLRGHRDVMDLNNRYKEEVLEIRRSLLKLHEEMKEGFFQEHSVNEVDNLNPYLVNENTTKYPVESDLDYNFFSGPYELNISNLEDLTDDPNVLDLLDQSETYFGYEIDKLKERLSEN